MKTRENSLFSPVFIFRSIKQIEKQRSPFRFLTGKRQLELAAVLKARRTLRV